MKEKNIFRLAEITETAVITHDDKLLLRAQKSDIGLTDNWRDNVNIRYENGESVIVNYILPDNEGGIEKVITPAEYEQLPDLIKAEYKAQPLRGLDIAEGITATFRDNRFDLILADLFNDADSRYKKALENVVRLALRGVIKYTPRGEYSSRNMREAIRHRAKKHVKPTEYEHDLLFRGEVGKALYEDLRAHDKAGNQWEGISYLQGFNRYDGIKKSVKLYDIGVREGSTPGEYFKIETTFYKGYFKENGITVNELLTQPEIQDMLRVELIETITRTLNKCRGETLEMLENVLEIEPPRSKRNRTNTIARELLGTKRTYTERLEEVERRVAEHERRIRRLENRS